MKLSIFCRYFYCIYKPFICGFSFFKWHVINKSSVQQSQLTHYPERKIEEFQLRIEALQQEYKRFITKLRSLDPSCKQKPWTPRAYTKRRADMQNSPRAGQWLITLIQTKCFGFFSHSLVVHLENFM